MDVRAWGRVMENELLKLAHAMEGLKVELPKEVLTEYKKSVSFEMGLVRIAQVSYEYGYQVALAHFQARYLELKVEKDPFKVLPEYSNMPMEAKQSFDDSLTPPEE
ncbi:hypothetical protein B296_00006736 [Ensete ventricosum]|uniref:Uncharacterized protein n=1 Tax=Ensete ventricosum TaxID=4639 RepID=A0A426Z457_ENSVE|nr:hypothetical protein B296_00006736 [Ensete ventricosum]